MRGFLFWAAFGVLLPQALWVRRTTPRFQGAVGETSGQVSSPKIHPQSTESDPPLQVVGLGDSIIAGVGAHEHSEALVAQAALSLSETLRRPIVWQVHGKIGADAKRIAREASQVEWPESVDVVVISTGVNDLLGLQSIQQWSSNIEGLIQVVRVHAPEALIVFCGLPPMDVFPSLPRPLRWVLGYRARHLDQVLGHTAEAFKRVVWVPVQSDEAPALTSAMFAGDGFHPGPQGYQALGQGLARAIEGFFRTG